MGFSHLISKSSDVLGTRMFFCKEMRAQIKTVFQINHIICARYVGFSQINRVFLKKTHISADNVGFFQRNPLYLKETHIA